MRIQVDLHLNNPFTLHGARNAQTGKGPEMSRVQWQEGRFMVTSFGNGLAYEIAGPAGSLYIQGDDSGDFRAGYDAAADPESYLAEYISDRS